MTDNVETGSSRSSLSRRTLLRTVGVGAARLTALSGIASAHQSQFFGCSQVCTDTEGNYAVVFHRGEYECRPITRSSDRDNLSWDWGAYCYEANWDEAVVGMIEEDVLVGDEIDEDGTCTLCLNPNRCAQNYYESPADIVEALDEDTSCAPCMGSVELGENCEVSGSSGNGPRAPPGDNRADWNPDHDENDWNGDDDATEDEEHERGHRDGGDGDRGRGNGGNQGRGNDGNPGRGNGSDRGRGHDD